MKILTELSEKSLGINPEQKIVGESFKLRKSARAIVINQNGLMAVQHIQKYNYHKLPGGTMEEGEKIEETLRREIREEIGCEIDSIKPVGTVIEYQNELIQISYCFSANMASKISEPNFDEAEIENDQRTIWLNPTDCLDTFKHDLTTKREGDFIITREIAFLSEFLSLQNS